MATSFSLNTVNGTQYTWASSGFAWNDARAGKTWGTAYDASYTASIGETVSTAETAARGLSKPVAEGFATAEARVSSIGKKPQESLTTSEMLGKGIAKPIAENFTTVELAARNCLRAIAEAFATAEAKGFGVGKMPMESLRTVDTYSEIASFMLRLNESFATGEKLGKAFVRPISESWATLDALRQSYGKNAQESWATAESYGKAVSRAISESLTTADSMAKAIGKWQTESWATSDAVGNSYGLNPRETLSTLEIWAHVVSYHLTVSEAWQTSEMLGNSNGKALSEQFRTLDAYLRNSNAIVSDVILQSAPMSISDFMNEVADGHAPGFGPFQDFAHGNYTYQDAIFRVIMQSVNTDLPVLTQLKTQVDMPDVIDRGEATISAAQASTGVYVTYNRSFATVPVITVTLKGGAVIGTPKVIQAPNDTNGFTLMLLDGSNNGLAGTLTWAAHGF